MDSLLAEAGAIANQLWTFATGLWRPWPLIQIGIIALLWLAAHLLARVIEPRLDSWMRGLKNKRVAQLRALIVLVRRTRSFLFVTLAWAVYLAMRAYTWPSRSFLIGIVATLAAAWVFVAIASRLIRNEFLSRVVSWGAWIFTTIQILDVDDRANDILNRIAIDLGETRISALLVLQAMLTLGILLAIAAWLSETIRGRIRAREDMSPSIRVFTEKVSAIVLYVVAAVIGLQMIGFDLSSLTLFSGAVGLGVGFGLQKVVSNLISGLIVLLDKSIKPGDVISLGETFGWVTDLNARYAGVVTRDGREYLIPNEDLITNQVVNWTHSSNLVRLDVHFGVAYASDPHLVRKVAREAAAGVKRVQAEPGPVCHITGFGDSSIDFILRFWITDPTGGLTNVRGDVYLALWDALKANGIEIPFPRRDVTILGDGEDGPVRDAAVPG